jgi:hypothetical protein
MVSDVPRRGFGFHSGPGGITSSPRQLDGSASRARHADPRGVAMACNVASVSPALIFVEQCGTPNARLGVEFLPTIDFPYENWPRVLVWDLSPKVHRPVQNFGVPKLYTAEYVCILAGAGGKFS